MYSFKALVVDDSSTVRKVIGRILSELGFIITEAENGKVALEKTMHDLPDIIMLDWNMPIMNGMEFFKEFKASNPDCKTKVIFCTTENELDKIMEAVEEGADEYIMKPFNKEILQDKLVQVGLLSQE